MSFNGRDIMASIQPEERILPLFCPESGHSSQLVSTATDTPCYVLWSDRHRLKQYILRDTDSNSIYDPNVLEAEDLRKLLRIPTYIRSQAWTRTDQSDSCLPAMKLCWVKLILCICSQRHQ